MLIFQGVRGPPPRWPRYPPTKLPALLRDYKNHWFPLYNNLLIGILKILSPNIFFGTAKMEVLVNLIYGYLGG